MELMIVGVCGAAGSGKHPLLTIDAAYTNYLAMAERTGRKTVGVVRTLDRDGNFTLPDMDEIEKTIQKEKPGALLIIPYDNPTGHFYNQDMLKSIGELCVKYNLWMVSDEAYRELFYLDNESSSSIWKLTEKDVPGITGRRISIESTSKTWNACGLRVGALVTDNEVFHEKSVAEYTANLCANAIGQYIYGALAHLDSAEINRWFGQQRQYYRTLMTQVSRDLKESVPGLIVSSPDAAIYSVIDVREITGAGFNALDFVLRCAQEGSVNIGGKNYTLLVSPMSGFYQNHSDNPGITQMRIAYVEPPDRMKLVPELFSKLFASYK
jgi:aspartate aminotransferase